MFTLLPFVCSRSEGVLLTELKHIDRKDLQLQVLKQSATENTIKQRTADIHTVDT